jgi:hypothetical protein
MRPHQLAAFQLHVPFGAGPGFFVPPISRKQKRPDLIDDLSADFIAVQMSTLRNENRGVRRRPKPAQSWRDTRRRVPQIFGRSEPDWRFGDRPSNIPTKIFHSKRIRPMRFFEHRTSDTIVPDERGQTRQSFVKLLRISKRRFK